MPPDPTRGEGPTQFQNLSYPPVQIIIEPPACTTCITRLAPHNTRSKWSRSEPKSQMVLGPRDNQNYCPDLRKQWYDPEREFRVEESQAVLNVQWGIVWGPCTVEKRKTDSRKQLTNRREETPTGWEQATECYTPYPCLPRRNRWLSEQRIQSSSTKLRTLATQQAISSSFPSGTPRQRND